MSDLTMIVQCVECGDLVQLETSGPVTGLPVVKCERCAKAAECCC